MKRILNDQAWVLARADDVTTHKAYWHENIRNLYKIEFTDAAPIGYTTTKYFVKKVDDGTAQATFDTDWTNRATNQYDDWHEVLKSGEFKSQQ